ncbi:hypothetical protein HELRODRAFT_146853, partial [Helobdella robusta]|uniref:Rab-GAP TBC domain-containing protein n=1 Tax=Helobdella robusta TaxID=6412 RepID=T1EJV0_HELRO
MTIYYNAFNYFFKYNLPKLYKHFTDQKLTADLYIIDWIFSIYSRCLNLDLASRVWDVFFRDGEQFLFRTALGILKLFQSELLDMDFIAMAQFLSRPPEAKVGQVELFRSIEGIAVETRNHSFKQI